jgi:hypothetical protein
VAAAAIGFAVVAVGVARAAPPGNDGFASPTRLTAATGSYNGTNREATKETSEPDHAGNAGGGSVWYRWTAPATGSATFDTVGGGFDTLLAVYTGSSLAALTPVAANDDLGSTKGLSRVSFPVTLGTEYRIAVDGFRDATGTIARGTFALNWQVTPASATRPPNDNVASAIGMSGVGGITATRSTLGATKEPGEPDHAGNPGGASVWFSWRAPADGRWRFYTPNATFNTLLAIYTGISLSSLTPVASNDDLAWNNWTSSVTFDAVEDTTYLIAIDGRKEPWSGVNSGDYSLWWELLGPTASSSANDDFASAITLTKAHGPITGTNTAATKETGEPNHANDPGGASVWYRWTAPSAGPVYFDTLGSSFNTTLAVYKGSSLADLKLVAANDDIAYDHYYPSSRSSASLVDFTASAGTVYYVAIDGKRGSSGLPARGTIFLDWWQSNPPNDATFVAAGDIASCTGNGDEATAQLLGTSSLVGALGDLAYESGSADEFARCYDPSWGFAKARTRPTPGNHEYLTPGAAGYFGYFGAPAGEPSRGYYSYEYGPWHVVVLNSNCAFVGGCGPDSEQARWLDADLLAHENACTLAYWHHPLFSSGDGTAEPNVRAFWEILYRWRADVVLGGHAHTYERFAPQTPSGQVDAQNGIREFVIGTGGAPLYGLGPRAANSELVNNRTWGVLRLTLHPTSYAWEFLPAGGGVPLDTGTGPCRGLAGGSHPTAPAQPSASPSPNRTGNVTVWWQPASDADGQPLTYTLQHKDANDAAYTDIAGALRTSSYGFPTPEQEGTWTYRAEASDGTLRSGWSLPSAPVVVDKTNPRPPLIRPDRAADYAGGGGWWRASVTVTFASNGDPALGDGSPGSGVDPTSLPLPQTKSGTGVYRITGRVRDLAGNRSGEGAATVQVDSRAPTVQITCPSNVPRGSTKSATYTASDIGSGLATPASGAVPLDTSATGSYSVSVIARDNVGYATTGSCRYTVT